MKRKASERLIPILIDVTDAASIASAASTLSSIVGEAGLTGLVNNAGIVVAGPLEFLPIDALQKQLNVNVIGQIAVTQAFLPLLRKGRGRIINIGSISGQIALPFLGPYAASKFALEALTDSLRVELRPWNIPVSIIEPGNVITPIWQKSRATVDEIIKDFPQEAYEQYSTMIDALKKATVRIGEAGIPADVVAKVVWQALTTKKPKTRYIVGRRKAKFRAILFRFLPDRLRDWLIAQRMHRLRGA